MKKEKNLWKRLTLKSYLLSFFYIVTMFLFGLIMRKFVIIKDVTALVICLILVILFVYVFFKELYSSMGLKWVLVEK